MQLERSEGKVTLMPGTKQPMLEPLEEPKPPTPPPATGSGEDRPESAAARRR